MIIALIITNLIFNVLFGLTCGFIAYSVIKKKKQEKPKSPSYVRR